MLEPTTSLTFLGYIVNSASQSFRLPEKKGIDFALLREEALNSNMIDLIMLQRLAGKCSSMAVCIPGALFYIRKINRAISLSQRSSKPGPLTGPLRDEIEH